jgi:hypothetical protein
MELVPRQGPHVELRRPLHAARLLHSFRQLLRPSGNPPFDPADRSHHIGHGAPSLIPGSFP